MTTYRLLLLSLPFLLNACGGGGSGGNGSGAGGMAAAGGNTTMAPIKSTVSGTVLDKQGAPIPGVTVTVYSNNTNTAVTATTDARGAYAVAGLDTGIFTSGAPSDYAIFASHPQFGFSPAVADSAGAVRREDFNGNYRTVIRFLPMPARDVASANFTASRAGDRLVSLPRTGQTVSYADGDDASARQGVSWPGARFTDNADGTVSDRLTGLVWLKNADCFAPSDWSSALNAANQLASGACGLADGSHAGQWRMPNVNELESLVDVSQLNPAVPAGSGLRNVRLNSAYWSSTTYTALSSSAMAIRLADGRWINGPDGGLDNAKATSMNALLAVKSGGAGAVQLLATGAFAAPGGGGGTSYGVADDASLQLGVHFPSPRFVDKGDGTVADTATGLTWLKQADCIKQTWSAALATIGTLASGQCGLADGSAAGQWRMPNRAEMLSLSDRAPTFPQADYFNGIPGADGTRVTGPVIFNRFKAFFFYWTSSTDAADPTQAWTIFSCDFGVYNKLKSDSQQYTLAVR